MVKEKRKKWLYKNAPILLFILAMCIANLLYGCRAFSAPRKEERRDIVSLGEAVYSEQPSDVCTLNNKGSQFTLLSYEKDCGIMFGARNS